MTDEDVETSDFRICRCCLSPKVDVFSSGSNYGIALEILSGQKLEKTELRLCCRCRHAIRKFSQFRGMCHRAQKAFREFYSRHPGTQIDLKFVARQKAKLNLGAEPSQSNTLSISMVPEHLGSPSSVQISSTSRGARLPKNFTQDMLMQTEAKDGNQIEIKEEHLNVGVEMEPGVENELELESHTLSEHFEDDDKIIDNLEGSKIESLHGAKSIVTKKENPIKRKKKPRGVVTVENNEVSQKLGVDGVGEGALVSLGPEPVGSLSCPVCRQSFWTQKQLVQHLQQHVGETNCCSDCGQSFKRAEDLVEHTFLAHGAGQSFCCDKCGKRYVSKTLLASHIRRHEAALAPPSPLPQPLVAHYCVECDRHYKSAYILRQHFRRTTRHRDPNVYKFECAACPNPRRFRSSVLLGQHTRAVHLRMEQLTCHSCGGSYATLDSLQSHIKKKHMGYKPPRKWACTFCDKKFRAQNVLQNHIRIHTGEKPFACPVCHDRFRQKAALDTHVRAVHLKLGARRRRVANASRSRAGEKTSGDGEEGGHKREV